MPHNVILVGPMGAGKSTIGRFLAETLKWPFYDTDREVESRSGANIPWIFDVEGEEGFRRRESEVLQELCALQNCVIATGGGTVLDGENRKRLRQSGWVLFLKVTLEQQVQRTLKDKNRPLLHLGEDPKDVLQRLSQQRCPLYEEVADLIIESQTQHPKEMVKRVLKGLSELTDWPNNDV